jgi:hypothetical protein
MGLLRRDRLTKSVESLSGAISVKSVDIPVRLVLVPARADFSVRGRPPNAASAIVRVRLELPIALA